MKNIIQTTEIKNKFDKLKILFKNKVIFEMVLEDMEIWKDFEIIKPGYVRFPETINWNLKHFAYRKTIIKDINRVLKMVNSQIDSILGIKSTRYYGAIADKFIAEREDLLNKHLEGLREIRNKRKLELSKCQ